MGRFRIQFFLPNGQGLSKTIFDKNTIYSATSTDCTPLNLEFKDANYGIRLFYDGRYTALADVCLNNIMITHFVFYTDHVNYFKDLIESIQYYTKIALSMFLFKKDVDLSNECGFLKRDIILLRLAFKKNTITTN